MKRSEIARLPFRKVKKKGTVLAARMAGDNLVIDQYRDGMPLSRYRMLPSGYHELLGDDGVWRQRSVYSTMSNYDKGYGYWSAARVLPDTKEDYRVIYRFCNRGKDPEKKLTGDILREVRWEEEKYGEEKRWKEKVRKQERIDAVMNQVPVLPDRFHHWVWETLMDSRDYLFLQEEGTWTCTACGRIHKGNYKDRQQVTCPETGRTVQAEKRRKKVEKSVPVMVLQEMDKERSVARHFECHAEWSGSHCTLRAWEKIRYILGRNANKGDIGWLYGQINRADEFEQEWWDANQRSFHCTKEYLYPEGVKEALDGTIYQKVPYDLMAQQGMKAQYNKLMMYDNKLWVTEYLVKAGFKRIMEEFSDSIDVYYGGCTKLITPWGSTMEEVLGIDRQRCNRLRQADGGLLYLQWLKEEKRIGKKIPEETIRALERGRIEPDELDFIRDRMSVTKIMNYLERQVKISKRRLHGVLELWKDYLNMAGKLGMDLKDEIVYKPKDLMKRHDDMVEEIHRGEKERQAEELRKKYPGVEEVLEGIRERYSYEGRDFVITVPGTILEIIEDGRQLHHCGGASDRYIERIRDHESYIMFLRKKADPGNAWYTLEVEPGGTIRQKRSEYNRQPDIETVKAFLAEWQQELKKRMKEEDVKLGSRSRKIRMVQMKELREKDERSARFAETLEADLMEVG